VQPDTEAIASFLGGFVAGEGCFSGSADGRRFIFEVGLAATDRGMCELLHTFLRVGAVREYPRRQEHYDDEAAYSVQSLSDLVRVVVPFMDEHLPPSYKREQYLEWRRRLFDYWENKAKRVRLCTVDGCEAPRRAHGLCRRHLWETYRV
jgi:LAGLIDADG endonuclease